jgi:hypothetical protein
VIPDVTWHPGEHSGWKNAIQAVLGKYDLMEPRRQAGCSQEGHLQVCFVHTKPSAALKRF